MSNWMTKSWLCGVAVGLTASMVLACDPEAEAAAGDAVQWVTLAPSTATATGDAAAYAFAFAGDAAVAGEGVATVTVTGDADGKVFKHVIVNAEGEPVEYQGEPRGWLGVQIGEVPEPLAVHLESDERGVIIMNVAEESPAANAGLQVHDVIVAIDGEEVPRGDVPFLVGKITSHKPGDTVTITVLRGDDEQTFDVTLGERKESAALAWVLEPRPGTEIEERIDTKGHIFKRLPDGQWFVGDLTDDVMAGMSVDRLGVGTHSVRVFVDGDNQVETRVLERDGKTLEVKREGDGPIEVRRVDEDGNESVSEYQTVEELRAADEEAADLLESGSAMHFEIKLDNLTGLVEALPQLDVMGEIDFEELHARIAESRAEIEEQLRAADASLQEALEQLKNSTPGNGTEPADVFWLHDLHSRFHPSGPMMMAHLGKAAYSFRVQDDGSIEVTLRKGDAEIVKSFSSVEDMEERDAELYQKYQDLLADDEE